MTLVILWLLPVISTLISTTLIISSTVCQHLLDALAPNNEMSRQLLDRLPWNLVDSCFQQDELRILWWMLTFHPANLVTSVSHLWSVMWTWPVVLQEQPSPIHHCAGEPSGLLANSPVGDWWLHSTGCWQVSMAAAEALNHPSNHSFPHCMDLWRAPHPK